MSYSEEKGQVVLLEVPMKEIEGWSVSATKRKVQRVLKSHRERLTDLAAQEIAALIPAPKPLKRKQAV